MTFAKKPISVQSEETLKVKQAAALPKMRRLSLDFEEADILKLKSMAAIRGVNMSDVLRNLVKEAIA